ncbi:MAG: 2-dehydropantoate 2-reductase [Alphaproteobacteria bacterium]|nr:2-dehydropantoate 2-reductase [Alphaproteobacteria bacterium]
MQNKQKNKQKILVIGAGAIGIFYSSKLSLSGLQVILWCRSNAELIREKGIHIKSCDGDFNFYPHKIINKLDQLDDEIDFILIATKVLPDVDIVGITTSIINKNTKIILIQNGIHIEKNIIKNFSHNEIISALAFVCVSRESANIINHQDYGKLVIGNCNGKSLESCNYLAKLWQESGIEIEVSENIFLDRWKKLVWNGAFNPLSVILGAKSTDQILANELAYDLTKNIMKEICLLAEADNCKLPDDIIEKNIVATQKMKSYKTSMLLDYEAGRPMEIEAILGNAINFAKSKSISTPYLSTIYAIISNY